LFKKLRGPGEHFMNSYDVQDHGATAHEMGHAKKPWITPSLQIIALKSAQSGTHNARIDGASAHFQFPRS
jgi:hypothetical protein